MDLVAAQASSHMARTTYLKQRRLAVDSDGGGAGAGHVGQTMGNPTPFDTSFLC